MIDPDQYPYPINPPRVITRNFIIFFGLMALPGVLAWGCGW